MANKQKIKEQVFLWLYRTFTYFVPGGIAIYSFLIESLLKEDITVMQKIGVAGITTLAIILIIGIYFYNRHFKLAITKVTNEILECMNDENKAKLILKKRKLEASQDLFHNVCFVGVFVILWLLFSTLEKGIISLRGTLMTICVSMATGLGFNGVLQFLKTHK